MEENKVKPKRNKLSFVIIGLVSFCMLSIGLFNTVSASYEYGLNTSFDNAGDLDQFTKFGTPEIQAGASVVKFVNEEGLRFNMGDVPAYHFKEYIRFMVVGQPSDPLALRLMSMGYNDYPSYWMDSGYLNLYQSAFNTPGTNLTLTLTGVGSSQFDDIRYDTWYEYTADVYWCGIVKNATLYDMWGPVYYFDNITGRTAGQYNCSAHENRQMTFGSWLNYPSSDCPDINIDRIAIYWDNTTVPVDIGIADTDFGKMIYAFMFFIPIMIMTWALGKIGFLVSSSIMALIWMATQVDFTWQGIVIIGTVAITAYKGGY